MRILILLLVVTLFPLNASAEPISKAGAMNYYNKCVSNQDPNMGAETQKLLCACTAVQMQKNMTTQDVQAMSKQDQSGRLATNKMLVDVYAPCMQHPAKELYHQNCISNPETQKIAQNPAKTCTCMSTKIANYLSSRGPDVFRKILTDSPNVTDPMSALANDATFQQFTQSQLMSCLK